MDGMSPEVQFFFYLAAVICFVLAAVPIRAGAGVATRVGLLPLGLAFFAFPTLWNVGTVAF